MGDRDFSDSVKLEVIKDNLNKNNGNILCESCNKKIISMTECHFDHIYPFAKGGKSTKDNCQILCIDCNLRKNDKLLKDFALEEKARAFLMGSVITEEDTPVIKPQPEKISRDITKEEFDKVIQNFIDKNGNIGKVDFGREYNNLPSYRYVKLFYGSLNNMKKSFGIMDMSLNWNRENIKEALLNFIQEHGDLKQNDMYKKNGLPSLPCVISNYPECENFTDVKQIICGLEVKEKWTQENAISAGKEYLKTHSKITQASCISQNGLPSVNTIERLFGTLADYQEAVGTTISSKNEYISKEEIRSIINDYFKDKDRVLQSSKELYQVFSFSPSTISKRYGGIENLCKEESITIINAKKSKYTKAEVDTLIADWVKRENRIPKQKELTQLGLPSISVILKYYNDWREPFIIYQNLFNKIDV